MRCRPSFAGGCGFHGEAFHLQQGLQRFANLRFIVNDEHRARQARRSSSIHRALREIDSCIRHIPPWKELPSCSEGNPG